MLMYKHFYLSIVLALSLFIVFLLVPNNAHAQCRTIEENSIVCSSVSELGCHQAWCQSDGWCGYRNNEPMYQGCNGNASDFTVRQDFYMCPPGESACSGGGSCFTSDTKISTPDGAKDIKDIKEGDVVKSFDPDTGKITESTVTDPYSKVSDHIYTITTSDGSVVKTTAEHPFYVGTESDQLPVSTSLKIKSFLTRMKIYWVSGIHVLKTSF